MTSLRDLITQALTATDTPWALNRPRARDRMAAAVEAAVREYVTEKRSDVFNDGKMMLAATRHDAYAEGRRNALLEAATMLKRAGHRSAVTRVQELAAASESPARPRPATSPADGPGNPGVEPPTAPQTTTDTATAPPGAPRPLHRPQNGTSTPTDIRLQAYLAATDPPGTPLPGAFYDSHGPGRG